LEQDQFIFAVESLLSSQEVLDKTNEQLIQQDVGVDPFVYGENVSIERRRANLYLSVRSAEPEAAAKAANIWAENAYRALAEAHRHALNAETLRDYMDAIGTCPPATESSVGTIDFCGNVTPEEIQQSLDRAAAAIEEEISLSKGILPTINFSYSSEASIPEEPAARNRYFVILGGALAGFAIGAVIASTRFTRAG
jgi:hypothetical protein